MRQVSSQSVGRVACAPRRGRVCHVSRPCVTSWLKRSTLHRNNRAGYPDGGGIHELAAPKMHSQHVTMLLVSSYLTFSPFQPPHSRNYRGVCCYFLLHYSTLTDCFYIRKWDALCCPDFPLPTPWSRQRQTVRLLLKGKGKEKTKKERQAMGKMTCLLIYFV